MRQTHADQLPQPTENPLDPLNAIDVAARDIFQRNILLYKGMDLTKTFKLPRFSTPKDTNKNITIIYYIYDILGHYNIVYFFAYVVNE